MRVLDVGAGGGTISHGLLATSHPGSVQLSTWTKVIMALDGPNLEARRMDLFAEEFPRDSFDVVHARRLLEHLPGEFVAWSV